MKDKFEYIIDAIPRLKNVDEKTFNECLLKLKGITCNNKKYIFDENDINIILDYVISRTRSMISNVLKVDIKNDPLINMCDLAQAITGRVLEKMGANVRVIDTQKVISSDTEGHSFLVVGFPICDGNNVTDKYYLVDPTYRQFFLKENCADSKYLIKDNLILLSPDPGYYYLCNPDTISIASSIIEDGYITLDDYSAKTYGDSFYTTRRGYTTNVNQNKQSNISGNIYIKSFLKINIPYSLNEEQLKERGYYIEDFVELGKAK